MTSKLIRSFALSALILFITSTAQAQNFAWAVQIASTSGGTTEDVQAVGTDAAGNVYTAGIFWGTVDLDPGVGVYAVNSTGADYDIFVQKLDPAGNFIWGFSIGASTFETVGDIYVEPSGDFYLTGFFTNNPDFDPGAGSAVLISNGGRDIFFAKYTSAGAFVFVKGMGSTGHDQAETITVDGSGNIYLGGQFRSTVDFDPGAGTANLTAVANWDLFVAKYDPSGNYLWAFSVGGANYESVDGITISNTGNVLVTGYFDGANMDFDPGAGSTLLSTNGSYDIFVASYTSAGAFNWAKRIGGTLDDGGMGIVSNGNGDIFVTGGFKGSNVDFDPGVGSFPLTAGDRDVFILKLDAAGAFGWAKKIGGGAEDNAVDMALDPLGNLCITGIFTGSVDFDPDAGVTLLTGQGGYDIFVGSYTNTGALNWVRSMGGSGSELVRAVCTDGAASVFSVGVFYQTVDFNTDAGVLNFTAGNGGDGFIHKLSTGTTGMPLQAHGDITVYPNPTTDVIDISLNKQYPSVSILLTDITGRIIASRAERDTEAIRMDLAQYPAGTYLLQVRTEEGIVTAKLTKL